MDLYAQLEAAGKVEKGWDGYNADPPNELAIQNCRRILDAMVHCQLEATRVTPSAEVGVAVVWSGGFNSGRYAHIECCNDATVIGVSVDHGIPNDQPGWIKIWWVSDLTRKDGGIPFFTVPGPGELQLSLAESLEYIRHFLWANHKV